MCFFTSSWAAAVLDTAPIQRSRSQQHEEHREQAREEQGQQAAVLSDRSTAAQEAKNESHGTDEYQQVYSWEELVSDLVVRSVAPDVYG